MNAQDYTDSFQATEDGFSIEHEGVKLSFPNEAVIGLGYERSNSGELSFERLQLAAREDNGKTRLLSVHHDSPLDQVNPLTDFRRRVFQDLAQRAGYHLNEGEVVSGPRWTITNEVIHCKTTQREVAIGDVHSISWQEDEFIVHATEEEEFLRLPRYELNTPLLASLLRQFVPRRKASEGRGSGLGELIAELSTPTTTFAHFYVPALALVSILLAFRVARHPGIALGAMVAIGVATHFALRWMTKTGGSETLRHGEYGVQSEDGVSRVTIDWQDITELSAGITDRYVNGTYNTTGYGIEISDSHGRYIEYSQTVSRSEIAYRQLESLRDDATFYLANKMWRELQETGKLQWTPTLTITNHGIAKTAGGIPQFIKYADISTFQVHDGQFSICVLGDWPSELSMPASTTNFYPGFEVFQRCVADFKALKDENASAS